MEIQKINKDNKTVVIIKSDEYVITDAGSALDFLMSTTYETGCNNLAINKDAIIEEFFDLSSRLAGEILQKCINYHVKFAIFGDFSGYTSKALKDFIYECNRGKDIFFLPDSDQAVEKLLSVC